MERHAQLRPMKSRRWTDQGRTNAVEAAVALIILEACGVALIWCVLHWDTLRRSAGF